MFVTKKFAEVSPNKKTENGRSEYKVQKLKTIKREIGLKSKSQLIKACENIPESFRKEKKNIFAKIAAAKTKKEVVQYIEML